jgi:ABC-type transporter Mla subunit MlaD
MTTATAPPGGRVATADPFTELHRVLQDFRTFLDANVTVIHGAVEALHQVLPQVNELIDKLSALMTSLKAEIQRLDPNTVPLALVDAIIADLGKLEA